MRSVAAAAASFAFWCRSRAATSSRCVLSVAACAALPCASIAAARAALPSAACCARAQRVASFAASCVIGDTLASEWHAALVLVRVMSSVMPGSKWLQVMVCASWHGTHAHACRVVGQCQSRTERQHGIAMVRAA